MIKKKYSGNKLNAKVFQFAIVSKLGSTKDTVNSLLFMLWAHWVFNLVTQADERGELLDMGSLHIYLVEGQEISPLSVSLCWLRCLVLDFDLGVTSLAGI